MTSERSNDPYADPIWAELRALELSICAIRKAQGKKNPQDFVTGTRECSTAMEEFARDISRILALDLQAFDDDELDGAGASG